MMAVSFIIYLILMLAIGVIAYRRTQDLSDYILGGRRLGPLPSGLSAGASDMSGWLLMGLPGYAMAAGYGSFWLAGGLLIGTWLNWLLVAQRLRVYSQVADDALTLPAFFEKRFNDTGHSLRVVSAFFILVFFLFYTSAGLVVGGKLIETAFGIDYSVAVIVGSVAIISYTLIGGFLAVSWTDVIQGLLMVGTLVLVAVIAIGELGGMDATLTAVHAKNPELLNMFTDAEGLSITLIGTLSLLGWGLGYFGQPHVLARFQGIKSKDSVPAARHIAVVWSAVSMAAACLIGLAAVGYLPGGLDDTETAFMVLVNALFHPAVAGLGLVAILAAVMSTVDSQLLVVSSALTEDVYKAQFNSEASQVKLVKVARITVVAIAVVATLFALDKETTLLSLVSYAWAGCGAAFGPALIMSLYWQRMNKAGALAGIIVGGVTVVVWEQLSGGWFDLYEIIPGTFFAFIAIIGVTLITPAPTGETEESFERFETELNS